jgi:hypothetical protein
MKGMLFAGGLLILVCACLVAVRAQDPSPNPSKPGSGAGSDPFLPALEGPGGGGIENMSVEQLLQGLMRIREQRALLEKKEQQVLAVIRARIQQQRKVLADIEERLQELEGHAPKDRFEYKGVEKKGAPVDEKKTADK